MMKIYNLLTVRMLMKRRVFRQSDGLRLPEGGDFEALHCQPSRNFHRSTKLDLTTEPPLLGRCCYRALFSSSVFFLFLLVIILLIVNRIVRITIPTIVSNNENTGAILAYSSPSIPATSV